MPPPVVDPAFEPSSVRNDALLTSQPEFITSDEKEQTSAAKATDIDLSFIAYLFAAFQFRPKHHALEFGRNL